MESFIFYGGIHMKVWVVYEIARVCPGEHPEVHESTLAIFDSEEKAVRYIRAMVKLDHYGMENREPDFDRSQYVRFELDQQDIVEGREIASYAYRDEAFAYKYVSDKVR
jgi:hypothetical protein